MNVVVICTHCGSLAPYDMPTTNDPFGVWHWHQPCEHCGANSWAAHDPNKDWRTGKPLSSI